MNKGPSNTVAKTGVDFQFSGISVGAKQVEKLIVD
jgi:hypothetical protein